MAHRLLLDASSLMYRAFFSIPATVRAPGGQPINAVHGYLDMTANLIASRHPDECVHVYDDDWRPAPRVAAYDGYKAARPPDFCASGAPPTRSTNRRSTQSPTPSSIGWPRTSA